MVMCLQSLQHSAPCLWSWAQAVSAALCQDGSGWKRCGWSISSPPCHPAGPCSQMSVEVPAGSSSPREKHVVPEAKKGQFSRESFFPHFGLKSLSAVAAELRRKSDRPLG